MSEKDNRKQRRNFRPREEKEFDERVVKINRVSKTVKGGRRMRFSALVVIGDKKGRVGYGMGKANEVPDAIRKATEAAKKNVIRVSLVNNYRTITHPIVGEYGAGEVLDIDAFTGGYNLQAAFSTGYVAAMHAVHGDEE